MDDDSKIKAQDQLLAKLCSPSCLYFDSSLPASDDSNTPQNNLLGWIDGSFTIRDLELAIHSTKRKSSPGLDRFDYGIIRALPSELVSMLLNIYNGLYSLGLFPESWRSSLISFVPKSDCKGIRPIALLSCFLKVFEKMLYKRLQWVVETRFLLPDFQFGFRNSRSCVDNLVVLTNRIYSSFLNNAYDSGFPRYCWHIRQRDS